MEQYNKLNTIIGWFIFVLTSAAFILTVEPTASFWDCGEFISAAYKLQVPHPPGAPMFLLIGRMFSYLAMGDVEKVAYWINISSALSSAGTIMLLYWATTYIARKFVLKGDENPSMEQMVTIFGSGVVGALSYAFADSFWFSAVEAEVYAMSAFFTAFVFWAILKWETIKDEKQEGKWLILIAYMMGLSIGVHILNLVTIPALAFVYYFKKYDTVTNKGIFATIAAGGFILVLINNIIIPGLPSIAGSVEILFVNSFGLPFGSGIIFFVVLFVGGLIASVVISSKKYYETLEVSSFKIPYKNINLAMLCLSFIMVGYISYGIILVRSNFNPPIDENDPENIISFVSYLKREQYGDRPLVRGPWFGAQVTKQENGAPVYRKTDEGYEIYDHKLEIEYANKDMMLFPRMYSRQQNHPSLYLQRVPGLRKGKKPTMFHNITFLLRYQLGHMYWRYFLWNFAGREGDVQDDGWLAPWENGPEVAPAIKNNMARNNFFMLPVILGIIGFLFHYKTDKKGFAIVAMLFFLTGMALTLYLNSPPVEPRERDYIFAGSFAAFAIWIGLAVPALVSLAKTLDWKKLGTIAAYTIGAGVVVYAFESMGSGSSDHITSYSILYISGICVGLIALMMILSKALKQGVMIAAIASILCVSAPTVMAVVGWDDHDRSKRYHSVDSAKNLLNSCAKNAILFTGGDNDTFPLWYVQEVEGFRTDVRVCNLSLLNTHWYVKQMQAKAYDSEPLPITMPYEKYIQGTNDYLPFVEKPQLKNGMRVDKFIQLIKDDSPALKVQVSNGEFINSLPTKTFVLPVDVDKVKSMGILAEDKEKFLAPALKWTIGKGGIDKKDMIMLDMIANNNWERPIYYSSTLANSNYMNLKDHMQLEGLAYRLLPAKVVGARDGYVNTEIMYNNLVESDKMSWREMQNDKVFYDENYRRFPLNARNMYFRLAQALRAEGDTDKALKTIEHCLEVLPHKAIPYDYYVSQFVGLLIDLGAEDKAKEMSEVMVKRADEILSYINQQESGDQMNIQLNLYMLNQVFASWKNASMNPSLDEAKKKEYDEMAAEYEQIFTKHRPLFKQ